MSYNLTQGNCIAVVLTIFIANSGVASGFYHDSLDEREPRPTNFFSPLVVSANLGLAWVQAGESQAFYLQEEVQNAYLAQRKINSVVNGEIFLGLQNRLAKSVWLQWGVAAGIASNAKLSGDILADANPDFNNFTYQYKIKHSRVTVKGKLITDSGWYQLQPYVSASAGIGFNYAYHMQTQTKIFEEIPPPDFTAQNTTSMSYTLGVGLQTEVGPGWFAGLGYEYARWGKSELGRAPGQTLNHGIKTDNIDTNGVVVSLTYVG